MCSFLACVHGVLRGGKWNERVLAAMMQMMREKERLAGVYTPTLAVQPLPFGNTHAKSNHACSLKHTFFINSNDCDDAKTEAAVKGVFSSKSPSYDHDHDHHSTQKINIAEQWQLFITQHPQYRLSITKIVHIHTQKTKKRK